jgi:hypothetical protein
MAVYGPDGNEVEEIAYGTSAYESLNAQSAVAQGLPMNSGACHNYHTMVVTSGAGVSGGAVQLKGSLDGINWFSLGSAVTTNGASQTFAPVVVTAQPVQYLRADITTLISGGTGSAVVASG